MRIEDRIMVTLKFLLMSLFFFKFKRQSISPVPPAAESSLLQVLLLGISNKSIKKTSPSKNIHCGNLLRVHNALPGRDSIELNIFWIRGVPKHLVDGRVIFSVVGSFRKI